MRRDRDRPRSRATRARGRPRAGLSAARRARAASRGPPVQWPRDVDPRGAGRGAESRPRARCELDGAPGGRGPGRDGDGAGGVGRGAAHPSRRRRTRALGQPAGCRRDCRSGGPAARRGVRERAAGGRRPATAGGRRGEVARERAGASRRVDRDPAAGASRGRRRAHTLGFGNRARSPASHAAGQCHLHDLLAAGRGPGVRGGAARERPRGRARRGRRGALSARVGLAAAARRGHGLPRRHALQQDGHARPGRGGGGTERSGRRGLRGDQAGPDRPGRRAGAHRRGVRADAGLAGRLRRDRGGHRLAGRDRRPRRPNALPARGLRAATLTPPQHRLRGASCSCGRRTLRETPSAATAPAATTAAPT